MGITFSGIQTVVYSSLSLQVCWKKNRLQFDNIYHWRKKSILCFKFITNIMQKYPLNYYYHGYNKSNCAINDLVKIKCSWMSFFLVNKTVEWRATSFVCNFWYSESLFTRKLDCWHWRVKNCCIWLKVPKQVKICKESRANQMKYKVSNYYFIIKVNIKINN